MTLNERAKARLEKIRSQHGGVLTPEVVLDDATNARSPLHEFFTWDNTEAARRYRLIQAGQLIVRVRLEMEPRDERDVRVAVQMYQDTGAERGEHVYRHIADLVNNEVFYQEMLASAKKELQAFERRYRELKELRGLFDQIREVCAAE